MEDKKLLVISSPHLRSHTTTTHIMLDVCIGLLPALIASLLIFGIRSLLVVAVSVIACVAFEYLFNVVTKRPQTVGDLSAVVTGVLMAYCLPPAIPLWMTVIGAFVAIVIVKQLFGGIGQNFVNPALAARIVMTMSFPVAMTTWSAPIVNGPDAVASATVLEQVSKGVYQGTPNLLQMLLGVQEGCLGEVCTAALLIGGLYMIVRGVITPAIPVAYIATVAVCSLIGGCDLMVQLLSGGLMLGAIFMATDYTTSPVTTKGQIVFGIGCGLLTCFIRFFASSAEGVSFAILLMNILCPYIDRFTKTRPLGGVKA